MRDIAQRVDSQTSLPSRKRLSSREARLCGALAFVGLVVSPMARAATTLNWIRAWTPATPSGGAGTWVTNGTKNWALAGVDQAWTDTTGTDTAIFGNVGGTVTLSGTDVANAVTFSASGYSLTGGTLSLAGTTPTITSNYNATVSSSITDSGGFTTVGTGVLTLTGDNSNLTGNVNITAGEVSMGSYTALGPNSNTKTITISSGAALDMNGYIAANGAGFFNTLNIAGTGVNGRGALLNTAYHQGFASGVAQNYNVNLTANATMSLANDFAQLGSGYGTTSLNLNGYTLTEIGSGNYYLVNTTVSNGNINITNGQIRLNKAGGSTGSRIQGTGTINISGGYLSMDSAQTAGLITRPITLSGGGLISTGNAQADSPITLTSTGQLFLEGGNMTLTGAISGSSGLSVNAYLDPGTTSVILNGANTYTGGTSINYNTLLANTPLATGSSTGTGAVTVSSGTVLAGTGYIGNTTGAVAVNGTITAGTGKLNTNSFGTLQTLSQQWNSGGTYVAKVQDVTGDNDKLILSGLSIASSGFTVSLLAENGSTPKFTASNTSLTSTPVAGSFIVLATDTGANSPFASLSTLAAYNLTFNNTSGISTYSSTDTIKLATQKDGSYYDLVAEDVAATPEPGSFLMLSLAAGPAVLGRRRRAVKVVSSPADRE